jgi:hypothetical protein
MSMKKIIVLLFITAFCVTTVFAQELKLGGEVKTGVFWSKEQFEGLPATSRVTLRSMDDAGSNQGRYRLNMDYDNGNGFGMRVRINWEQWGQGETPKWPYAFGYGNFFEDQMTVAIGKLGGSPWGTGGPEMWAELESFHEEGGGMRIEWKPSFIPVGKLNVGFVLNWFDGIREDTEGMEPTLLDILQETVIGASYTHDLFMARAAVRLDSKWDKPSGRGVVYGPEDREGIKIVYRLEEHVIGNYLPGFSIWALGYLLGVGTTIKETAWYRNWLFVQYAPDVFTAQLRLGYDYVDTRTRLYAKPSFYWNFFNNLLSVGAAFSYAQDFGNKKFEGSPYETIEIEPKIQLNFSSSYIAFVYNFSREYVNPDTLPEARGADPIKQTQWMNLRFCIYY